jgi:hypothetical protein
MIRPPSASHQGRDGKQLFTQGGARRQIKRKAQDLGPAADSQPKLPLSYPQLCGGRWADPRLPGQDRATHAPTFRTRRSWPGSITFHP